MKLTVNGGPLRPRPGHWALAMSEAELVKLAKTLQEMVERTPGCGVYIVELPIETDDSPVRETG